VEKLRIQLEESTRKLHELVSVNQKLHADCCQLITEKRALEMRLEAVEDTSPNNNSYVGTKVNFLTLCQYLSLPDSSLFPDHVSLPVSASPLSPSVTPALFHSQLITFLFHKSYPP